MKTIGWILATKDGDLVEWHPNIYTFDPREGSYSVLPRQADKLHPELAPHRWQDVSSNIDKYDDLSHVSVVNLPVGEVIEVQCAEDDYAVEVKLYKKLSAGTKLFAMSPEAVEPVAFCNVEDAFGNDPDKVPDSILTQCGVKRGDKLYTRKFSPTATQALRMAADVCRKQEENWARYPEQQDKAIAEQCRYLKNEILSLIPPIESDQRKLVFSEGVKAAGIAFAASKNTERLYGYERRNFIEELNALTTPTDQYQQARDEGFAEGVKAAAQVVSDWGGEEWKEPHGRICKLTHQPTR